jgi:hypothetical protein
LKPVYQGEQPWQWDNVEQENGYRGAVDPAPYFVGQFNSYKASDYVALAGARKARVLDLKQATQLFALAKVLAEFGV